MAAESYVGVRVQGGLLPAELLSRIAAGVLPGQTSKDYHLAAGETVREAANRAWSYLTGVWSAYRQATEKLSASDRGTTLTRERWLLILLRELDYGRVPATPAGGLVAGDKHVPVSHVWEHVPIHLLGHRIELDKRTQGVAGAATQSPQSMVQELLNRSEVHQWALLSNGLTLRLLRDSTSLVGSSYLEFDLEAIFEGDLFADFLLLFSTCHQSRLEVRDPEKGVASCWVEAWRTESIESGSRALNQLRDGVVDSITTLGTGFLAHPANGSLRDGLADGTLTEADINHGLLRIVYRLLFTFVAEDRGLLLAPEADVQARERYRDYFSTDRLRRTARRRRGTRHTDQWRALNVVWDGLGSIDGRPELGLVGIGGLFEPGVLDLFRDCHLTNEALLKAVRHLSLVTEPGSGIKRVVDYRNLGAEELGSIYEALLEFVPSWDPERRAYELLSAAGNDRKSTGSYYTPTSLIDSLLDSALDPVLDRAEREADPETALLALTVCDPACGSGHFLVAAARRIAKRVAAIRTGDPEPPPERVREAMGDVVGRCIYGVDLNPLAAELAKVSLWLETLEPGRPLAFLDAQIKVGNSLIGTTPTLLAGGIPDEAFKAVEGDDRKHVAALRKQNKAERAGQSDLFGEEPSYLNRGLARQVGELLRATPAASLADVHARQQLLQKLDVDPSLKHNRRIADAWCAAFIWTKDPSEPKAVTHGVLRALEQGTFVPTETIDRIDQLSIEHAMFHWHLEFPHIFDSPRQESTGEWPIRTELGRADGFDVVLGNPPWERISVEDDEFFGLTAPEVLEAQTTAKRKKAIAGLAHSRPQLYLKYQLEIQRQTRLAAFFTRSGLYERGAAGRLTTQNLFAERSLQLLEGSGKLGLVLPTSVITDVPMKELWSWLVESARVESVIDFENRNKIFPIHASYKFMLMTANGGLGGRGGLRLATYLHSVDELKVPGRVFSFPLQDLIAINPITKQLPLSRNQRDVDLLLQITRAARPLEKRGWVGFTSEANSHEYLDRSGDGIVGLYEGKMIHQFDACFATYDGVAQADRIDGKPRRALPEDKVSAPIARFWSPHSRVAAFLQQKGQASTEWTVVVRDYARATDDRTVISAIVPSTAPIQPLNGITVGSAVDALFCVASMNSFCYDWSARQRTPGQHFNVTMMSQTPASYPLDEFRQLVLEYSFELSYTSDALRDFARQCGLVGGPFIWDDRRREALARELDAVYFLSAGLVRGDVEYIMDSFAARHDSEVTRFGEFRSKRMVLEYYDRLAVQATARPSVPVSGKPGFKEPM